MLLTLLQNNLLGTGGVPPVTPPVIQTQSYGYEDDFSIIRKIKEENRRKQNQKEEELAVTIINIFLSTQ